MGHHNVRIMKTFLLIACVIAATAATSEDNVVPEYEHDKHKLTFEDTNLADLPAQLTEMLANGRSEQECLALADATETEVDSSVAAQQSPSTGWTRARTATVRWMGQYRRCKKIWIRPRRRRRR